MPTVKYTCPDSGKSMTRTFPYNAVRKAQEEEFSKLMKGNKKNNPNRYSKGY